MRDIVETALPSGPPPPSLGKAIATFARIGILSFGGPAAQIALMNRILVDEKKWLTQKQYLSALSFCMLLPGPEAMQLAVYSGWKLHGLFLGLMAGILFVLPGAIVVLTLAIIYGAFGDVPVVSSLFLGVKAAVFIIVVQALMRLSKSALAGTAHWVIAALAFIGIFFLSLPYPLIVIAAALYGLCFSKTAKQEATEHITHGTSIRQTITTLLIWLAIWFVPLAVVDYMTSPSILGDIGTFFSKLALVTFGGAYTVLAYMAQDVVTQFGWLTAHEMLDGFGLAETTPGPLILVTEFVGYLAAYHQGGFWFGLAGAAVTLWATFIPCFMMIFTGAPYIEWISAQPRLNGALAAITAAVVGVILNLSLWFGLHVLFQTVNQEHYAIFTLWRPELSSIDWHIVVLSTLCAVGLLWLRWGILTVLFLSALLGWGLVTFVG
ncbi:chromate transporter [Pseudovibrio japonicus]|uniref:Chromate transporter n=1 Tax=Pseudovibrio japonicus TaxID=366534 RepID=A0ABQ3EGU5_9HYPH|nr:chromate efflux transporter [Pseudovibrio japonicus]GHB34373.1 chromate transporter [Pseudovibrio japonicus]